MYQEKHHKKSRRTRKSAALLVSLLLLLTVTVGSTIAFLVDSDGPLHNLFNPSDVTTKVEETLEGNTKKDVKIQNTGDTDAWIRAAVVITWQDAEGNVYGQVPAKTDYDIIWGSGWKTGSDGFYYWPSPVAANTGVTGDLIESISLKGTAPADGYYLTVEIIGSGIQNKPANVFNTEWASSGLKVDSSNSDPMQWTLVSK
ncbi:MAG: hypothetical protein J6B94_05560 [Lachnospiraceae bacterium]|nr:hypothetical protein [Lachnospiraceae bacterium]